jgi:trimethylamine--corrinoid protein Co-methyltransferase
MDMKTTIFSYGAPEMSLMVAAMAQMAQYYKVPFFGTAGCSDAKFPDAQAAAEVAFSCLASALVGANLVHDAGSWLDHGSLASPAFMVLVNEILYMVDQFTRGLPVNDETLALEIIDRVGPGGHYLYEEHTLQHFRDVWYSDLFDRSIHQMWLADGARTFEQRLRDKTAKLMNHQPTPLAEEIHQEMDRMAQHWK